MTLAVTTWLWGDKYDGSYVRKLAGGVLRHLNQGHRFICFTDRPRFDLGDGVEQHPIDTVDLLKLKGCFARLRLFDPSWLGSLLVDKVVNLDLDVAITGPLDRIFNRPSPFMILGGANSSNPCPFNGSVFMLDKGHRPDVWSDFSLEAARAAPFHEFPDDQGWMHHKMPDAATWPVGYESGIYAFGKNGWPANEANLPSAASIVAFPGWRDPKDFRHLPWVQEHWR